MRNISSVSQMDSPGLSPKKTLFIMVTVVGCIAILWPKVFYPMMFGSPIKQNAMKDHRGGTGKPSLLSTCCEVVLDKDAFFNASLAIGEFGPYRKHVNLYNDEISLRQERPPHLRSEPIHPAMRERGRAIPATPTVPIIERARAQSSPPRVVEGHPGPIPGMRPPLGAGSVHQASQKTSSMGFIMPLYTIGIVAFFIYTITKILFKKPVSNAPYGASRADPSFHKEVFGHEKSCCSGSKLGWKEHETRCSHHNVYNRFSGRKHVNGDATPLYTSQSNCSILHHNNVEMNSDTNNGNNSFCFASSANTSIKTYTKIDNADTSTTFYTNGINENISTASICASHKSRERDQLKEIEKLRRKLEETERAMAKLIAEMNCDQYKAKDTSENVQQNVNGHVNPIQSSNENEQQRKDTLNNNDNDDVTDQRQYQYHHDHNNKEKKLDNECLERKQQLDDHLERSVVVLGMEMTASCEGGRKWNRPPTPVFIQHNEHSDVDDEKPNPELIYLEGALPHESQILVADSKTEKENVVDEFDGSSEEPAIVLSSKMTLSLINLDNIDENKNEMEIINGEDKEIEVGTATTAAPEHDEEDEI